MPNPNAIVAVISSIVPPVTKSGVEMFREYPDGFEVELEPKIGTVRMFPGVRAAGRLEILEGLRRLRTPAYLEIDPNTRGIIDLLIPLVSRVEDISEKPEGQVIVALERSHTRHVLNRANQYFDEFFASLRTALANGTWLVVTETDQHEIIDVRPHTGELPPGLADRPREPRRPPKPRNWFARLCYWFCCLFRGVSRRKAKQMFDLCSSKTCNPLTVPPPCIPFLYPDDGCWARAHEMCRLMIAAGVHPRKVWIDGNLHTLTKNNPNCFVDWGWHVAPTLCVRIKFFSHRDEVIDPSLFTDPVSKATWKGVQGDPSATLTDTSASIYYLPSQTDPTYSETNFYLDLYRLQLQNRSLSAAGPPPYASCP